MDALCFDLINLDMKHSAFPKNACRFIVKMASIQISLDCIPVFDAVYEQRVGELNGFEAVAFYSDFTRLMNA